MKKTATALLLPLICGVSYCQTYSSMWNDVDKALGRNLPKTALSRLRAIRLKAESEGDAGQMMKAAFMSMHLHEEVSPDSAAAQAARLDSLAAAESRPAVKAVLFLALAETHRLRQRAGSDEGDKALACYGAATADLGVFDGRKSDEFAPAVVSGDGSGRFGHSLAAFVCWKAVAGIDGIRLASASRDSIEGMRRDISRQFISRCRTSGNGDAVILATLDSLRRERTQRAGQDARTDSGRLALLRRLIAEYGGSACAAEAYIYMCDYLGEGGETRAECLRWARLGIERHPSDPRTNELRNIVSRITRPRCTARLLSQQFYEGQSAGVPVSGVNVGKARIALYRLPFDARGAALSGAKPKELRRKARKPEYAVTADLSRKNEYDDILDTVNVTFGKKGVFLMELTTDMETQPDYNIVYVSGVRLMSLPIPGNRMLLTVVNARSGHPIPGAKVAEYRGRDNRRVLAATYTADEKGELELSGSDGRAYAEYYPYTADDAYCRGMNGVRDLYQTDYGEPAARSERNARLYTDRAVYRPGQKVRVGGIVYDRKGNAFNVLYDQKMTIALYDTSSKELDKKEASSDEFGAFGAEFELPQTCLPGMFCVEAGDLGAAHFRVEEYKRPTFRIDVTEPDAAYSLGDTVSAECRATTFTETGVAGARVIYEVKRDMYAWKTVAADNAENTVFRDTSTTDGEGKFAVRIPLVPPQNEAMPLRRAAACGFTAYITVTSPDGESQEATARVAVGKEPVFFSCDLPDRILKSNLPAVTFSLENASGTPLKRKGTYYIIQGAKKISSKEFDTGKPERIVLPEEAASGRYRLEAKITGETDSAYTVSDDFILFSLDDKRPADDSPIWTYATSPELPRDSDMTLLLGTSLHDVNAFCHVIGNNKIIESRHISMDDTVVSMKCRYKENYGNGIAVVFGFMRDGTVYCETERLAKPAPDKKLRFKWSSFRDRLQPGQKEEWSLNVFEPDGSPAEASAIAALYDASLDMFSANRWNAELGFYHHIPAGRWVSGCFPFTLNSVLRSKHLSVKALRFDDFHNYMFSSSWLAADYEEAATSNADVLFSVEEIKIRGGAAYGQDVSGRKSLMAAKSAEYARSDAEDGVATDDAAATSESTAGQDSGAGNVPEITARENFAETAFFMPALKTDENGGLSISFTVPESMTKWNFKLLAHTKDMNTGLLDTTAVVAKDFTVQPNLPRYLRKGDRAVVAATLRNLKEEALEGTARLVLLDARNEAEIEIRQEQFKLEGGSQTVVRFNFNAPEDCPLLICKITASAGEFSDGEQHYLPVLSDETESISALPFSLKGKGIHTIEISPLFDGISRNARATRLTVEYTANPLWYAVRALPCISEPKQKDAVSIATAFYAASLEQTMARLFPEITKAAAQSGDTLVENALLRNEDLRNIVLGETPWAAGNNGLAQEFNTDAAAARSRGFFERLALMQQSDGGWSWFPGMKSSWFITERVLDMLVRLETITGEKIPAGVIPKGIGYMDKEAALRVKEMKKLPTEESRARFVESAMLPYLDILRRSTYDLSPTAKANRRLLTEILAKHPVTGDMYSKSLSAGILFESGYKDEARTELQSLLEHTVVRSDIGRYFDTDRAKSTPDSYKIPTHVAAIEALRLIVPGDTAMLQQMLAWLMQAKRTQSWNNERSTVDAVYVLLRSAGDGDGLLHFSASCPAEASLSLENGTELNLAGDSLQAAATLGYMRKDLSSDTLQAKPVSITITKNDDGISWGGIYCRTFVPAAEAAESKGELSVKRTYLIEKNGRYVPVSGNVVLKTGSRVRVEYTVTAARDFDFVSLQDAKPACFEPVKRTSGYTWSDGEAYYHAVGDSKQGLFFEHMSKGVHKISSEFTVDRAGRYLAGTADVQCQFSPEFAGTARGFAITSE